MGEGVQRYVTHYENRAVYFKLGGNPWWANTTDDACASRALIVALFEALIAIGWRLNITMETSRRLGDKSVFVLETCRPYPMQFMCLSLNSTDHIRFINADEALVSEARSVISQYWPPGVSREERVFNGTVPDFKVNGNPWGSMPADGVFSRAFMCAVLALFERAGWTLITSADVSAKYHSDRNSHYPLDVDSWFLARPKIFGASAGFAPPQPQFGMNNPPNDGAMYPTIDRPPSYDPGAPPSYYEAIGLLNP